MIEKLKSHYSMTNPASVYDEEALTSLELAGRTAAKVNEIVEAQNTLKSETDNHLAEQDERLDTQEQVQIPETVTSEVQKQIDNGTFDDSIDKYAGELIARVNNLVSSIPEGSTTMDAEVIDIRTASNGMVFASAGEAVRAMFGDKSPSSSTMDLNTLTENGVYFWGSSTTVSNLPEPMGAGACLQFNTTVKGGEVSRTYQIVIPYTSENGMWIRKNQITAWSPWQLLPAHNYLKSNYFNNALLTKPLPASMNLNDINQTGLYYFGSGDEVLNAPYVAGCVMVLNDNGHSLSRWYQLFLGFDSSMYLRHYDSNNSTWTVWSKISGGSNTVIYGSNEGQYELNRLDAHNIFIYKKGVKGYVRYNYRRQLNASINLDTYRLAQIHLCDNNKNVIKTVSDLGADLDGVVLLSGDDDHLGGVHGDEQYTDMWFFVNGKQYTFDTVPSMLCDSIQIIVKSNITHMDTLDVCMTKIKQTTFDRNGVHINCEWEALEVLNINSIRGCMFSIDKGCFTHWYDSNVNRIPTERTTVSTTNADVTKDSKVIDIHYVGDISAHHWCERKGTGDNTLVLDYGTRYKSYFTCYDGHTTTVGEKMSCINHFNIEY